MTRACGTAGLVIVATLTGCILPDRDIRIESGIDNENAVRIVQRAL